MESVPKFLTPISKGLRLKHFPRGQTLLYRGDPIHDIMLLSSGVIKIYVSDEQDHEKILHLLNPPAVIPFTFFSGDNTTRWCYAALTDCDIYVIPVDRVRIQMLESSDLARGLLNDFASDVHELLVRLDSLGKTDARAKVVAALKFLAVKHAQKRRSGWHRVKFSVSHQLLADLTGLTRERVATVMRRLQVEGFVRSPRQTILDINLKDLVKI